MQGILSWRSIVAAVALMLTLTLAQFAWAQGGGYEVWIMDQADANRGGAKLYIYQGSQLEGSQYTGTPQVVDLNAEAAFVGDGPGTRPHLVIFNNSHSHALIANVASGHVYFMRAATRKIVASIDVGVQAHAAYASPDDKMVLVANQNGKKLARITTNFATDSFTYNAADDLDLAALEDAGRPDNAPICPLLFAPNGKDVYVTLRGGGMFIVDASTTPMKVVKSFDKNQIAPAGCGGIATGNKIFVNSGTATTSDLYVFDALSHNITKHIPFTPVGIDGHGMAMVGKYLWMNNRGSGNIVVVDTTTDAHVTTIANTGAAPDIMDLSPDGNFVFAALRGPNNLTGGPTGKGQTPGLAVFRVSNGGASGARSLFVPIGSQEATSQVDPHSLAVRRVTSVAMPAALPTTGSPVWGIAALLLSLGLAMFVAGVRLRQRRHPHAL